MLIRKTSPKGIDKLIDRIQLKLDSSLDLGTWENNHRAYRNLKPENNRGYIAELYTEKGEYRECFYNDNFDAVSFFFVSDNAQIVGTNMISQDLHLIFHVDLNGIFPSITHRADEELKLSVYNVLNSLPSALFTINSIETGLKNVYKEFENENFKYDDLSNLFCVRFNLSANYLADCCIEC